MVPTCPLPPGIKIFIYGTPGTAHAKQRKWQKALLHTIDRRTWESFRPFCTFACAVGASSRVSPPSPVHQESCDRKTRAEETGQERHQLRREPPDRSEVPGIDRPPRPEPGGEVLPPIE